MLPRGLNLKALYFLSPVKVRALKSRISDLTEHLNQVALMPVALQFDHRAQIPG